MYETLAKPPRQSDLETWYAQAGFSAPEVLFSTLYFHLLAAVR